MNGRKRGPKVSGLHFIKGKLQSTLFHSHTEQLLFRFAQAFPDSCWSHSCNGNCFHSRHFVALLYLSISLSELICIDNFITLGFFHLNLKNLWISTRFVLFIVWFFYLFCSILMKLFTICTVESDYSEKIGALQLPFWKLNVKLSFFGLKNHI